jgi:hypothetical protein
MQNKKLYIILPVVIILVAAAAFVGGRLLNGQAGALGFLPFGNGTFSTFSVDLIPAPELPTTQPETSGTLFERKDNTLTLQTFSMEAGSGGGVVSVDTSSGASGDGIEMGQDGPKVEVVTTKDTKVFKDVTQFDIESAPSSGSQTIQQAVEPGSLDEMGKQAMITVWGRKNGDRIIAEVVSYSDPVMIQK